MSKKQLSDMIDHLTDCMGYDHAIIIVGKRQKSRMKAEIMSSSTSVRELKMLMNNSRDIFIDQMEQDEEEEENEEEED